MPKAKDEISDAISVIERELSPTVRKKMEKLERKRRKAREKAENEAVRHKEYLVWKKSKEKESLKYAEAILKWAKMFAKSETGKQIISIVSEKHFDPEGKVEFFGDQYLDFKPGGYGCHAHLSVNKKGSLVYREGYKWMGWRNTRTFDDSEKMAKTLDPRFIKSAYKYITSGEASKRIMNEIRDKD